MALGHHRSSHWLARLPSSARFLEDQEPYLQRRTSIRSRTRLHTPACVQTCSSEQGSHPEWASAGDFILMLSCFGSFIGDFHPICNAPMLGAHQTVVPTGYPPGIEMIFVTTTSNLVAECRSR